MPPLAIALWIASVLTDTAGRLAFKAAARDSGQSPAPGWRRRFMSGALWAGVACFALELVVWLAFLSLVPLSQAILLTSFNIVSVAIAARYVYGERLTRIRLTGFTLIAVGVALVSVPA